jgi:flagellar biogenesis protein FliO
MSENPCMARFRMTAKTTKFAVIMAGLILAGGLLSAAIGASTSPAQMPPASSEQIQRDAPAAQSTSEQFSVPAGREFFYKMLVSIVVVIVLGAAVIYVSKKLLPKIANLPGKQIRVVETNHLGQRKALHLIQIGSKRLLIGSTNETITMLADVTESGQNFAAELEKRS